MRRGTRRGLVGYVAKIAVYCLIGRHLEESEQTGKERVNYGSTLKAKLAMELAQ